MQHGNFSIVFTPLQYFERIFAATPAAALAPVSGSGTPGRAALQKMK
jgi:hypothetical protein